MHSTKVDQFFILKKIANREGNGERGTGNGEPGTGNRERGTGNREPGTGNRERGTGNGEPGTGNRERGIKKLVLFVTTMKKPCDKVHFNLFRGRSQKGSKI